MKSSYQNFPNPKLLKSTHRTSTVQEMIRILKKEEKKKRKQEMIIIDKCKFLVLKKHWKQETKKQKHYQTGLYIGFTCVPYM